MFSKCQIGRQKRKVLQSAMLALIAFFLLAGAVRYVGEKNRLGGRITPHRVRAYLQAIRSAVILYMVEHPNICPSMEMLVESGVLEPNKRSIKDAWKNEYQIKCDGNNVTVLSAGPDEQFGTKDDVKVGCLDCYKSAGQDE